MRKALRWWSGGVWEESAELSIALGIVVSQYRLRMPVEDVVASFKRRREDGSDDVGEHVSWGMGNGEWAHLRMVASVGGIALELYAPALRGITRTKQQ